MKSLHRSHQRCCSVLFFRQKLQFPLFQEQRRAPRSSLVLAGPVHPVSADVRSGRTRRRRVCGVCGAVQQGRLLRTWGRPRQPQFTSRTSSYVVVLQKVQDMKRCQNLQSGSVTLSLNVYQQWHLQHIISKQQQQQFVSSCFDPWLWLGVGRWLSW